MKIKKRIILGHSYWGRGGAEVAAMWLLQVLCHDYQVDIVTRGGWDLDALNECSGTDVRREYLGRILYPPLIPRKNGAGGALWHGLYLRYCRHVASRYDLRLTASRVIDWGRPAIHFLSDVTWNKALQKRYSSPEAVCSHGLLRRVYYKLGEWLAGNSSRPPEKHDLFVANSKWTAEISINYCETPPVVIYPAVPEGGSVAEWENRENSFVCLGRISPEKNVEIVIEILDQVRRQGHQVRLHLIGDGDDESYMSRVRQLCDDRSEWVEFHGPKYGADKQKLLTNCRYGISACDVEAFGIATAEMVQSGVVTFVPEDGAQSEIVYEKSLIYADAHDAAMKIDAVLKSESLQMKLNATMMKRSAQFNPGEFSNAVHNVVYRALNDQRKR